jgi:glycosyltransferase involved in cell wall biosynthesis
MPRKTPRVMWLLNHGSARTFEVTMLKRLGIREIFLPKQYPADPFFRSASIDFSEDSGLTVPENDLRTLNAVNWYESLSREAWDIANRHFDILFFILHSADTMDSIVRNFHGAVIWRGYGVPTGSDSYSAVLNQATKHQGEGALRRLGHRFWFAYAYEHQLECERGVLAEHGLYLPLGLADATVCDTWNGADRRVLLICPDLGFNAYYQAIYKTFSQNFRDVPYAIGGAQSLKVDDPRVLGYLPEEDHRRNLREFRVMFYHSTEPNHIHYHPFEAIQSGMPLVFMAGGILDRFGGYALPGRCRTVKEATAKVKRILNDDWSLINDIRGSQMCLLDPMKPDSCISAWRTGLQRITEGLDRARCSQLPNVSRKTRIAVILPAAYRGGSLRGAKLVARAIETGSRVAGDAATVILGHPDDPCYSENDFADLPASIRHRPFTARTINREEAYRAMVYAGLERPMESEAYLVFDDGIRQFMDCDFWVLISDRLEHPVVPVRPYALLVYDYIQRYEPLLPQTLNQQYIRSAHMAERVFVTTVFTRQDAVQFAGLPERKVVRLPMLIPLFSAAPAAAAEPPRQAYFLWATNLGPHKNHENSLKALRIYYEEGGGRLDCCITGVNTRHLLDSGLPHLGALQAICDDSPSVRDRVKVLGEVSDRAFQALLAGAEFLWHPARIDNGTFSVVEAAHMRVPSLSSDYPAMREIDAQFSLNMSWMDAHDVRNMALALKLMETEAPRLRGHLPPPERLAHQSLERLARTYWEAFKECL